MRALSGQWDQGDDDAFTPKIPARAGNPIPNLFLLLQPTYSLPLPFSLSFASLFAMASSLARTMFARRELLQMSAINEPVFSNTYT